MKTTITHYPDNNRTALILSDFGLRNYGNRLQSFAVINILRKYGYKGFVFAQVHNVHSWLFADLLKRIAPAAVWRNKQRYLNFRSFARSYTPYRVSKMKDLKHYVSNYDCVIIGSDQVWSPTYLALWDNPLDFFLLGVSPKKKIAFSPSIGLEDIPLDMRPIYSCGLSTFTNLSIREESGARIIEQLCGKNAIVLADPTIGVRAEEWRSIADYSFCPDSNYLLTYYLGNGLDAVTNTVYEYATKNSLMVVNLMDKNDRYYDAGPAEFIGLIDRASYVVTDSFHGSIFSMLLHTPFTTIKRTDVIGSEMFSRIETLANIFGCRDRVLDDDYRMSVLDDVEWAMIDEKIEAERKRILNYIAEELARCGLV